MKEPLVSVIIPAFNRVDFLALTLKSVIDQTYKNTEIIVVDDGSPHNKLEQLCGKFSNISYYKIKNSGGPATPRNYGILKANGKYIAFLDDDDLWLPNKLEIQVGILEKNPEYGLVHCSCAIIDEYGVKTGKEVGKPKDKSVKHGDVKLKMIGNWTLMMPTPLLRSSLIKKTGLFNVNIPPALEDVEFWTKCSFFTKFFYVDESLALYRIHSENISKENKNYIILPLYLKDVLDKRYEEKILSRVEYKKLISNICLSQARHAKKNVCKTIINLFKINAFWFIDIRVVKTLIKKILRY